MQSNHQTKFNHAEAFCLMWYRCDTCGHVERVWNSRDGITPFSMSCMKCGARGIRGGMNHTNWSHDACKPDHKLKPGQFFWRDGTREEAAQIMRDRIDQCRDQFPCTPEREAELIQSCLDGTCMEFQKGWPMLDQAPEEKPKTETVLVVTGTIPVSLKARLNGLAMEKGVSLKISEEERPVSNVIPDDFFRKPTPREQIHIEAQSGKRRHKQKGRNRRKW